MAVFKQESADRTMLIDSCVNKSISGGGCSILGQSNYPLGGAAARIGAGGSLKFIVFR
jgi:hypothetical protein